MRLERQLLDGSNVYPDGIIGPSSADQKEFRARSYKGRIRAVEPNATVEIFTRNLLLEPQQPLLTRVEDRPIETLRRRNLWPKKYAAASAVVLNAFIAACAPSATEPNADTTGAGPSKTPEVGVLGAETSIPNINVPMPIASGVDVFYTGGPHNWQAKRNEPTNLARGAIDIAPGKIDCVNGIVPFPVVATANGDVTLVDESIGFVDIKVAGQKDLVIEYEHLAGINKANLSDGKVKIGESIADGVGCSKDQKHLHFQLQNSKGEQLPIAGSTIGGWTIYEYEGNYDGYAVDKSGQKKIADENHIVGKNDFVIANKNGVGNVTGPGTTEVPIGSPAPENLSVDQQIENLFSNITPENQEQAIDIIAVREWLRYLNKPQVDSSGNILQTQILNFSEFGADQLEGLLRDEPTTVPLKVSAVHLEKRDTYTVKSNYDLELENITLFRGQRFNEFGHRAITYQLRFRGLIYILRANISDEMAKRWVNKIPDEEMSEWSEFYWGEVYIFNDRDGIDETVKLQGNMDNTKNDEIQIPFKIKRISENYMNENVQRPFHQYAPDIACTPWSEECIDVDLEDLNSSSW